MRPPKAGERLRAITNVKVRRPKVDIPILEKGKVYEVKAIADGCCGPLVDIGYIHPVNLKRICSSCGSHFREKTAMIPAHYFRRARQKKDPLILKLDSLEEEYRSA